MDCRVDPETPVYYSHLTLLCVGFVVVGVEGAVVVAAADAVVAEEVDAVAAAAAAAAVAAFAADRSSDFGCRVAPQHAADSGRDFGRRFDTRSCKDFDCTGCSTEAREALTEAPCSPAPHYSGWYSDGVIDLCQP